MVGLQYVGEQGFLVRWRGKEIENNNNNNHPIGNHDCTETGADIVNAAEVEADISASLDTVGVNEPLLFNLRSSRLEDLVGEMGEVEKGVGLLNVFVKGRRGEMPERSSSISDTDWVRGKGSTVVSPKKFPCPVKKQNLQGRSKILSTNRKKKEKKEKTYLLINWR
jgi:hypothetical protein